MINDAAGLPSVPRETLEAWYRDALVTGPSRESWAELITALRAIQELKNVGRTDPSLPDGMYSVMQAISAIYNFLQADNIIASKQLAEPIYRLIASIVDLGDGRQPALLTAKAPAHRPGMGVTEANVMAIAARAMDELMRPDAKHRLGRQEAAERVARIVRKSGLAGSEGITWKTVAGWRDRLREGDGGAPASALERWRTPLPSHVEDTPEGRSAYLMAALSDGTGLR